MTRGGDTPRRAFIHVVLSRKCGYISHLKESRTSNLRQEVAILSFFDPILRQLIQCVPPDLRHFYSSCIRARASIPYCCYRYRDLQYQALKYRIATSVASLMYKYMWRM
jgi:hypothetical protein